MNTEKPGLFIKDISVPTKEQAIANAKLIAQAPALLEALNLMCETMKPYIYKLGVKKGFTELTVLAQAQTAIHKATATE